jgi:hypothetical protein
MFSAVAQGGEDYFLLMFASQGPSSHPRCAHTFATFVRVSWDGNGPCPDHAILDEHTISWLPTTMVIRTYALLAECGTNFGLHPTLRWAMDTDAGISLWGPFRICPELYFLALKQISLLESGQVRYKAIDAGHPTDRVSNCIHAVSTTVEGPRLRIASPGWGDIASFAVLKEFAPYVIDRNCIHPEIASALGLDDYPINYRNWQRPPSGLLRTVLYLDSSGRSR